MDNPISVLNQEDARSFHKLNEEKIYSLFRKATNLDQTEANYVTALENCNKAISIWNRKNEVSHNINNIFINLSNVCILIFTTSQQHPNQYENKNE